MSTTAKGKSTKKKATAKTAAKKTLSKKKAAAKATAKKAAKKKAASKAAAKKAAAKTTTKNASKKKATGKSTAKSRVSSGKPQRDDSVKPANISTAETDLTDEDIDIDDTPAGSSQPVVVPYERGDGHYMDAEQLAHFSRKLAEWKQQLMEEVDRTVGHMKDDATNFPDPNDRATQEEEFSLELRTRDRERKLIKKINEAQKRIDDDEYGYCETCGIEIGINRLEARPTAELCIDCKTLEEIRERQTA